VEVVAECADAEEALRAVDECHPDVVVMDLHLPGMSGVEAIRRLAERDPAPGVVALTTYGDDSYLQAALRAGARGYLVKGADHQEIVRAVLGVARGEAVLGTGVSGLLAGAVGSVSGGSPFPELTQRELEVLEQVALGRSNAQIAARLHLSPKTVRNYVSNTLARLHLETRSEAIARARDAGLVGPAPQG